jgi:hypothetical protein
MNTDYKIKSRAGSRQTKGNKERTADSKKSAEGGVVKRRQFCKAKKMFDFCQNMVK